MRRCGAFVVVLAGMLLATGCEAGSSRGHHVIATPRRAVRTAPDARLSTSPRPSVQKARSGTKPDSPLDPARDPAHVDLSAVRPLLAHAYSDAGVVYRNGCHVFAQPITRARFCVYGDRQAQASLVLFGDSHVAQWFPAFDAAARAEHLKLLYITKSSCPAQSVSVRVWQGKAYYQACDVWRARALALIEKQKHVALVVMGGFAHPQLTRRFTNDPIIDPTARAKEWGAGTGRTLTALRGVAAHVVILRDTPLMRADSARCLVTSNGDNRACETSYARASADLFWTAEQQAVSAYGQEAADFTSAFCTASRCRPVTSTGVLRWRDQSHMSATFARLLAPRVRVMIRQALAGRLNV
jgi:SGNH domain (fused to AT3 domains)